MRKTATCMLMGLLLVVVTSANGLSQTAQSAAAPPPHIGTWKFNPQKSKMNLTLAPRSLTRKYEDRGGGVYIFTQEGISADGTKMFSLYVAKDDGTEYPLVIQGADDLSSISLKRIDTYTTQQTERAAAAGGGGGGGGGMTATRTVSRDGKTLTLIVKQRAGGGGQGGQAQPEGGATQAEGEGEMDVMVFDRQP